jgi:hypothetical protein
MVQGDKRLKGEKQRFITDLARAHHRIESTVNDTEIRPETALPRSKSVNRHVYGDCLPEDEQA